MIRNIVLTTEGFSYKISVYPGELMRNEVGDRTEIMQYVFSVHMQYVFSVYMYRDHAVRIFCTCLNF